MRKQTNARVRARKPSTVMLALGAAAATTTTVGHLATGTEAQTPQVAPGTWEDTVARARPRMRTHFVLRRIDRDVLVDQGDSVAGYLRPALRDRLVTLQVRHDHRWRTVARSRTRTHGGYVLRYSPALSGHEAVRVRFAGGGSALPSTRRLGVLNVYRLAVASWYESGGYPACGGVLTSSTLGVASRRLPCGTLVTLRYNGRTVRVPVIDRGPFVEGREFDLTEATKEALGFEGVGEVWTIS